MDNNNVVTYNWNDLTADIRFYEKEKLKARGLSVWIDVDIYKHDISHTQPICKKMKGMNKKDICFIYEQMRFNNVYTEENLQHLYEYEHPDDTAECKHGNQCNLYTFNINCRGTIALPHLISNLFNIVLSSTNFSVYNFYYQILFRN